ncbi:uncharacterized protein LOC124453919 [Xenia sp. Carnegie-2017]|uniref:uncharacterized protein LOC124453919 n=1 Tax=Xenia sp. Carnegie-2017 TaxID=2897299 RepID=UPI001F04851E|nr:uncharacterized protein LOC124453919 [Xenia sp. Carnegie-2017]
MYRRWMFTAYGSSSRRLLADIFDNSGISYHHHQIHLKIYKPLTLELINMNSSYNGEYTLIIHSSMGHYSRSINVYIVVPTSCLSRFSTTFSTDMPSTKNGSIEALSPTIQQSSVFASTKEFSATLPSSRFPTIPNSRSTQPQQLLLHLYLINATWILNQNYTVTFGC